MLGAIRMSSLVQSSSADDVFYCALNIDTLEYRKRNHWAS